MGALNLMNKNILFSATRHVFEPTETRYGQAIINAILSGGRIKIVYKFIRHIAIQRRRVVLRKRISGRTLPGKSHLKQKRKNCNAPHSSDTSGGRHFFCIANR